MKPPVTYAITETARYSVSCHVCNVQTGTSVNQDQVQKMAREKGFIAIIPPNPERAINLCPTCLPKELNVMLAFKEFEGVEAAADAPKDEPAKDEPTDEKDTPKQGTLPQ